VFLPLSVIMDKVLYTPATSACIHDFVNVPFLSAVFSDDRPWPGRLTVREEEWVVWDVSF
jgi:hypothetical protein